MLPVMGNPISTRTETLFAKTAVSAFTQVPAAWMVSSS